MRRAQPDDLDVRAAAAACSTCLVCFPSGQRLRVPGVYTLLMIDGAAAPAVRDGERVVVLDPRAVVVGDGGRVVYDPRQHPPLLPAWAREWLAARPDWPRVVTEALP